MVLQGVLLSTAASTFVAKDVKSKLTRECNSPQFLFHRSILPCIYQHAHERTVPRGTRKSCLVMSALDPQEVLVQISRTSAQPRSVPASPSFFLKKKRELPCAQKSLSKGAGCLEDTPDAECLSLKTSGKPKRFRSKAGGTKWQRNGRRLL